LEAREAKEIEDIRTALFVKGTHTGEVVNGVMKELVLGIQKYSRPWRLIICQMALKRPNAIPFSKKNTIRPFEDASSLEFWADKNDASMFLIGQSTKKRPAGLIIARTFDSKVLDMCELGVDKFISMAEFQVRLSFTLQFNALMRRRHQNRHQAISP